MPFASRSGYPRVVMPTSPLSPIALSLLAKRYPRRRPAATKERLEMLLAKAKVRGHAPALAFERTFGVLSFPDYGSGRSWTKSGEPAWLIGAVECLSSDLSFRAPGKRKLVPVLYTTNDNVVYLAEDGVAWGEDTVGDTELSVIAPNARAMMTRVLLGEHVFFCPDTKKVTLEDARGKEIATLLKLRPVTEASDPTQRWWSDGTTFIVERAPKRSASRTTVAYAPKGKLTQLGITAPTPKRAAGPVTFDSVMNEYPPVCVVSKVPMTFDVACRSIFDSARLATGSVLERRTGGAVSLAGKRLSGTVTAIDDTQSSTLRVQLSLVGDGYTKKKSRVEVFLRDFSEFTMVNVYQFDVKPRLVDEIGDRWREVIATFGDCS